MFETDGSDPAVSLLQQVCAAARAESCAAADRLVAEMKDRGWKATEPFPDRRAVLWALDRDDWTVTVVSGEASPEEMASGMLSGAVPGKEDGFKGVMFYGFGRDCGRGTATPTP